MKKYYVANIESLRIQNLVIGENTHTIVSKQVIVEKDALFYKNLFGVIIRFKDKCPLRSREEALDYVAPYLCGQVEFETYNSGEYYDEDSLSRIEITKEREKQLIKERRNQRKSTK